MIDANVNRCSEGLRVLEDVARFVVNDAEMSQQFRSLRHDLARETKLLNTAFLSHRDSEGDVGRPGAAKRVAGITTTPLPGMVDLVRANAKRVAESLRVIEELARLPEMHSLLNAASFGQMRFDLYTRERNLVSRISRRDKATNISGLYVILDRQVLAGKDELDVARQTIEGGARIIQLRDKQNKKGEILLVAQKLMGLCKQAAVLFIVNDHLDIAIAVDADGVHIGQEDLPLSAIRRQLPIDKIVGCSVRTASQASKAQTEGADYIAVGSVFPTTTKEEAVVVGVATVTEVKRTVSLPLVAVGGISERTIPEVVAAGADSVAVASAVLNEKDVRGAVRKLVAKIELAREKCRK